MNDGQQELSNLLASSPVAQNATFDPFARPDLADGLARDWTAATLGLQLTDEWFGKIWNLHVHPSRHYHTAVHLHEMLSHLHVLKQHRYPPDLTDEDYQVIVLAVFFHDAIYNSSSSSNEQDSAKLFEQFALESGLGNSKPTMAENIAHYIRATQKHEVKPDNSTSLALFLDLDMAVLGKTEEAYQAYAALIRNEYSIIPRFLYCKKRAEVLESFLSVPNIYGTHVMKEAFEHQARLNIRKEIDSLREGVIYGHPHSNYSLLSCGLL